MLSSQRALFDIPRDVCYLNAASYSPLPLWTLEAGRAEPAAQYRIVLSGGEPLPPGTQVIGRGSRLHFLTGTNWHQLEVGEIPV